MVGHGPCVGDEQQRSRRTYNTLKRRQAALPCGTRVTWICGVRFLTSASCCLYSGPTLQSCSWLGSGSCTRAQAGLFTATREFARAEVAAPMHVGMVIVRGWRVDGRPTNLPCVYGRNGQMNTVTRPGHRGWQAVRPLAESERVRGVGGPSPASSWSPPLGACSPAGRGWVGPRRHC